MSDEEMVMLKRAGAASIAYLAYALLLLAFVLLGVFVAALAHESRFAAVAGVGLVTSLAASVMGFRVGASRLARASEAAGSAHKLSIWADPLRAEQIDQYCLNYGGQAQGRQQRGWTPTVVANTDSEGSSAAGRNGQKYRTPPVSGRRLTA
jgi:hypothetical protein